MHQRLVASARTSALYDNVLDKFCESEQKVLTRLLLEKQYKGGSILQSYNLNGHTLLSSHFSQEFSKITSLDGFLLYVPFI